VIKNPHSIHNQTIYIATKLTIHKIKPECSWIYAGARNTQDIPLEDIVFTNAT
jgi:hypothetical protein